MKDSLLLLSNFIKKPKETGAVAPSSKFLTKEIIKNIDFKNSKNIVELGPGVGTFTKAILEMLRADSRLICFEVNKKFCDYLGESMDDSRLLVVNEKAEKLCKYLKKYKISDVDCIVSGLPFKNFGQQKRKRILQQVRECLSSNGSFVLFQYTNGLLRLLEAHFPKVERKFVPLNIPPCFVYVCEK